MGKAGKQSHKIKKAVNTEGAMYEILMNVHVAPKATAAIEN